MSRFDLFFIICDEADNSADVNLANFIVDLHRKKVERAKPKYDYKTLKKYISVAKKVKPRLTRHAAELIRKFYIEIRSKDKVQSSNTSYRITVRQL
jgi:DNA replication licensing factor MCM6